MKAQFAHLKFNSMLELNDWLDENTHIKIELEDNGQDLQKIWIHESGEILNTDFQGQIYIGKFIEVDKLCEGSPIRVWSCDKFDELSRLVVENISRKEA